MKAVFSIAAAPSGGNVYSVGLANLHVKELLVSYVHGEPGSSEQVAFLVWATVRVAGSGR